MTRDQKLQAKAQGLERWAISQNLLKPGERIDVSIAITKVPLVNITMGTRHRERLDGRKLSPGDWQKVLTTPNWKEKQRQFLDDLRNMGNGPMKVPEEFETSRGNINTELRRVKLPFQLRSPGRGATYNGTDPVKLVRVY